MKVDELIEKLNSYPVDARVVVFDADGTGSLKDITCVDSQPMRADLFGPGDHDGVTDEEIEAGRPFDEIAVYLG